MLSDKALERTVFYDDKICRDVKMLTDLLVPLVSSYRLEVGSADELNKIALAHRHDVEEAIKRADDLGEIIDEVQDKLKRIMKIYLNEMTCKIDFNVGIDYGLLINGAVSDRDELEQTQTIIIE